MLVLIDLYAYQAFRTLFLNSSDLTRKAVFGVYWGITLLSILAVIIFNYGIPAILPLKFRTIIITALFITYFSKVFGIVFLLLDDLRRGLVWLYEWVFAKTKIAAAPATSGIPRSEFVSKVSIAAIALPLSTMTFGIVSGAHDYRVRRRSVYLPHLPQAFDGMRIAQLSDIHSGSFFNKKAVMGGVDMLLAEKPDLVFFTGDLVNNESSEFRDYFDVFKKVKAPLGVFSTLGNHDYGDYSSWPSAKAKKENLDELVTAHRDMGWQLLRNENRTLKVDGESLGIIGVENWGAGGFAKYGDLEKAYERAEEHPVKLLLSHDPSHWDAIVRPKFRDIDLTFAGHTHGFQFGIEIGGFKWSPSQYIYKQWADLYQEGSQYLYVNRGFGYIGYPGRIGILPEITIIELKKG